MTDLKAQLKADLALRERAKALVAGGLNHVRGDVSAKGIASRTATRMREGAEGMMDDSAQFVRENPGRIGSGVGLGLGLVLAWIFRDEIAEIVDENWHYIEDMVEQITASED